MLQLQTQTRHVNHHMPDLFDIRCTSLANLCNFIISGFTIQNKRANVEAGQRVSGFLSVSRVVIVVLIIVVRRYRRRQRRSLHLSVLPCVSSGVC